MKAGCHWRSGGRRWPLVNRALLVLSGLTLAACASRLPPRLPPPLAPVPANANSTCNLAGCCAGHGEVAYLQPDRFVMCTDGEPSMICDCHL